MQGFLVGSQEDYSIFYARRERCPPSLPLKSPGPAPLSLQFLPVPSDPESVVREVSSRESDLNFLLNPRFSFDNGVRSRPRVYRDEMRFSPHSNKPLAPTGLYLLSLLPPLPANFRFYAPLRAFQLDAHSSTPSLRSLCKSGMKFFRHSRAASVCTGVPFILLFESDRIYVCTYMRTRWER